MKGWIARVLGRATPSYGEAEVHDAGAFSTLHAESFRRGWSEQELEQLLLDRQVSANRAMLGRHVVGFIMSRQAVDEAEILTIAVAGRQRGRGIGRALLEQHLRALAGRGVRTVFLEVDEGNAAAQALYGGAGFRQVAKRPSYYPGQASAHSAALVYRRDLWGP